MFDPMKIIKLREDEIVKRFTRGKKYFLKTKYFAEGACTGGYHKYFRNLSAGRYKYNSLNTYDGWGGPRTWKFIVKHMSVVDKILSCRRPIKILDIGCTSGFVRKMLESNTFGGEDIYYYGVDASENELLSAILDIYDVEAAAAGDNITSVYINHDTRYGLPFEDESFDFVTSFEVTKYLTKNNVKKLLREISRVLKPNGIFFHSTSGICNDENMMNFILKFKNENMKSLWYLDEFKRALNEHGLNIMKIYGSEANYETIRKLLKDEDRQTFIKMDSLYPKELMQSIFGPLYPYSTDTKLLFISKGVIDPKNEVENLFPNKIVNELTYGGNSKIFVVEKKIIKYLPKNFLEKYMNIYKILREQTNIKLPKIFDIKESQISDNYLILMEYDAKAIPLSHVWNKLNPDEKKEIIHKIVNMLKQTHSIKINQYDVPSNMRLVPDVYEWKDEVEKFLKKRLDNSLKTKKLSKDLYNYFNLIISENIKYVKNVNYVLINNDLNLQNLIINEKKQLFLTFDFEMFESGDRYLDVVVTASFFGKYGDMIINLYEPPENFDKISKIYRIVFITYRLGVRRLNDKYRKNIVGYVNEGGLLSSKWFL